MLDWKNWHISLFAPFVWLLLVLWMLLIEVRLQRYWGYGIGVYVRFLGFGGLFSVAAGSAFFDPGFFLTKLCFFFPFLGGLAFLPVFFLGFFSFGLRSMGESGSPLCKSTLIDEITDRSEGEETFSSVLYVSIIEVDWMCFDGTLNLLGLDLDDELSIDRLILWSARTDLSRKWPLPCIGETLGGLPDGGLASF